MLQRPSERPRQVSDDEGGGSGEEGADQSDQEKEDDTVDSIEPKIQVEKRTKIFVQQKISSI